MSEKITTTVFTNPLCEPCTTLKNWLNNNQVPFIEKDIINDPKAAEEFYKAGTQYTPHTIIIIKEEKFEVVGAFTKKIERILGINQPV